LLHPNCRFPWGIRSIQGQLISRYTTTSRNCSRSCHQWRNQGGGVPPAPLPRNWVHKKIPGCAVELNTQNCAWFGSQLSLITAMSFREAMPPRTNHQGFCPWTPLGDFRSPDPLCPHLQILAAPLRVTTDHSGKSQSRDG